MTSTMRSPISQFIQQRLRTLFRRLVLNFGIISTALVAAQMLGAADGQVQIGPSARLTFEFSDLPEMLATVGQDKKEPARLTALLPENYSAQGRFPLCVFLNGGDGGRGDRLPLDRKTIGSNDFIIVSLPLFKSPGETGLVKMSDFEAISRAYRAMLGKLMGVVPNITPERSALGGFSNGAHTIGVLLARQDKFILDHFTSYYLIEGGFGYSSASFYPEPLAVFSHCRFLFLYGDQPSDEQSTKIHDYLARAQEISANQNHIACARVVMEGIGHSLPPNYQDFLGRWIRGEAGIPVQ
jgi:hypothetical protein